MIQSPVYTLLFIEHTDDTCVCWSTFSSLSKTLTRAARTLRFREESANASYAHMGGALGWIRKLTLLELLHLVAWELDLLMFVAAGLGTGAVNMVLSASSTVRPVFVGDAGTWVCYKFLFFAPFSALRYFSV